MTKNKIVISLGIVSILGFLAVALASFGIIDVGAWVQPLTFIIFGGSFMLIAGGTAIFKVLEDGKLDTVEIMRILTAFIGLFSVLVGIPLLPIGFLQNFNTPAMAGVRGFVAMFAVIFIAIETFYAQSITD